MQKEKWWKRVWSDWKSEPWFYVSVTMGSAAVAGGSASYVFNWPYIYGAEWWSAISAIGTTGAVVAALFIFYKSKKIEERKERRLPYVRALLNQHHATKLYGFFSHVERALSLYISTSSDETVSGDQKARNYLLAESFIEARFAELKEIKDLVEWENLILAIPRKADYILETMEYIREFLDIEDSGYSDRIERVHAVAEDAKHSFYVVIQEAYMKSKTDVNDEYYR